jgi:hypothetical protein
MTTEPIICHACHKPFPDFPTLCDHIVLEISKKGTASSKLHRKSAKFAHSYKNRQVLRARIELKPVSDDPDKVKTEYGDSNRENARLQLSGEFHNQTCKCPKCQSLHRQSLPVEFLNLEHLWIEQNKPMILCESCRR